MTSFSQIALEEPQHLKTLQEHYILSNFTVRTPHLFQIYDLLGKLIWISFNGFLETFERSLSLSPGG